MQGCRHVLSFQLKKIGALMATPPEKTFPDIAIYPDLNIVIRTPAGREYRGRTLEHDSQHAAGEKWYQVIQLTPQGKDNVHASAVLNQQFDRKGRPDYFPPESTVVPLTANLNRIPAAKRTPKNADTLIATFWDADGLWTALVKPSKSEGLLFAGSLLPAQAEIGNTQSKIAQYQRPAAPGELPVEMIQFPEGQTPGVKG
jgi:hypothetical protein